jgi:hypothetical protein
MTLILLTLSAGLEKLLQSTSHMNLDTILTATYYIKFHKLTALEHYNTIIMNWHQTLKYPVQDLSPSRLIEIYPVTSHFKADIFHRFCKLKGISEKQGKMIMV